MGEGTAIEWADHTFNPWIGCAKISAACTNCYAEAYADRWHPGSDLWRGERRRTSDATWRQPLRWQRQAEKAGTRPLVFCASLADVFEDRDDVAAWRVDLFELILSTPNLTWLLLTKRPGVALRWYDQHPPPANVWHGTTVEHQDAARERLSTLLRLPGIRFASCEPLLGPVDLAPWLGIHEDQGAPVPGLQWVIAGGESGPDARPSHPTWFQFLRDQVVLSGARFLFKQWGEWLPFSHMDDDFTDSIYRSRRVAEEWERQEAVDELEGRRCTVPSLILRTDGRHCEARHPRAFRSDEPGWPAMQAFRVGKVRAGRTLDGRTWDQRPMPAPLDGPRFLGTTP